MLTLPTDVLSLDRHSECKCKHGGGCGCILELVVGYYALSLLSLRSLALSLTGHVRQKRRDPLVPWREALPSPLLTKRCGAEVYALAVRHCAVEEDVDVRRLSQCTPHILRAGVRLGVDHTHPEDAHAHAGARQGTDADADAAQLRRMTKLSSAQKNSARETVARRDDVTQSHLTCSFDRC